MAVTSHHFTLWVLALCLSVVLATTGGPGISIFKQMSRGKPLSQRELCHLLCKYVKKILQSTYIMSRECYVELNITLDSAEDCFCYKNLFSSIFVLQIKHILIAYIRVLVPVCRLSVVYLSKHLKRFHKTRKKWPEQITVSHCDISQCLHCDVSQCLHCDVSQCLHCDVSQCLL